MSTLRTVQIYASVPIPDLSLDNIKRYFCYTSIEAAKRLGVSYSKLKKVARNYGIKRWPYRKIKSLDNMINKGDSEEKTLAIHKKELLLNDPNIIYTDLISGSKNHCFNIKLRRKHKWDMYEAKKYAGSKIANKLPSVMLNSQIQPPEIQSEPIFKNIIIDSETESDSEEVDGMLYIDETPFEEEAETATKIEVPNKRNDESESNKIYTIRLTHGEIECSQSEYYFLTEQCYNF